MVYDEDLPPFPPTYRTRLLHPEGRYLVKYIEDRSPEGAIIKAELAANEDPSTMTAVFSGQLIDKRCPNCGVWRGWSDQRSDKQNSAAMTKHMSGTECEFDTEIRRSLWKGYVPLSVAQKRKAELFDPIDSSGYYTRGGPGRRAKATLDRWGRIERVARWESMTEKERKTRDELVQDTSDIEDAAISVARELAMRSWASAKDVRVAAIDMLRKRGLIKTIDHFDP